MIILFAVYEINQLPSITWIVQLVYSKKRFFSGSSGVLQWFSGVVKGLYCTSYGST